MSEQEARDVLERVGYHTQNLWHINDVKGKYKCTDAQAMVILTNAMQYEATYEQIWMSIDAAAEIFNVKKLTEE